MPMLAAVPDGEHREANTAAMLDARSGDVVEVDRWQSAQCHLVHLFPSLHNRSPVPCVVQTAEAMRHRRRPNPAHLGTS
jgi:hypothetical protein